MRRELVTSAHPENPSDLYREKQDEDRTANDERQRVCDSSQPDPVQICKLMARAPENYDQENYGHFLYHGVSQFRLP